MTHLLGKDMAHLLGKDMARDHVLGFLLTNTYRSSNQTLFSNRARCPSVSMGASDTSWSILTLRKNKKDKMI